MTDIQLLREVTVALIDESGALPEQVKIQNQFARFQIKNIGNLADGFLILEKEARLEIAGCLTRPVVEAFLNLKASLADRSFAASKCVADISEAIKLDQTRRDKCPIQEVKARLQTTIDANLRKREELMKYHQIPSVRRWNAKEIAEVGDLVAFYDIAYSTFHPSIHAGLDGNSMEPTANFVSLVVGHFTIIVMDTIILTLQQFAPEKIPAYKERLVAWKKRFETDSTMP